MTCERYTMPGGGTAIVCGPRRPRERCACGAPGTLLCDWRMPTDLQRGRKKSPTCDAPLCERCTTKPAPDKDLCPRHAADYEQWKARKR